MHKYPNNVWYLDNSDVSEIMVEKESKNMPVNEVNLLPELVELSNKSDKQLFILIAIIVLIGTVIVTCLIKKLYRYLQVKARQHLARELAISRINLPTASNNPTN